MGEVTSNAEGCPVCGDAHRTPVLAGQDHMYGNPGIFRLESCTGCGLGIQTPMPSDEQLAGYYPDSYPCHQWTESGSTLVALVRRWLLCDTTASEPRFEQPGRMLDLGCGAGAVLHRFRRQGWLAQGVEPNPRAAQVGRDHGLDIIPGVLADGRFPEASFDYVRLDHSFEHIRCSRETVRELHRILRPGGRLFLAVPEFESTTRRWFGGHWWFLGLPVHTYQYSWRTLPRLLEREGFGIESVRVRPHLGGVLGSLEILLNRDRAPERSRIDLMGSSILRTLGQWASVLIALLGTGEVLEVTAVRPGGGPAR
jgi:SAM-dependent methyltransferase